MMKSITQYDTTTQEYVEIIHSLLQENPVTRIKDISRLRGVTPSTVSTVIDNLKKQNLVNHQKFGYVSLTPEGNALGEALERRHQLVRSFLVNVLGVNPKVAQDDACMIEHVIAAETCDKLLDFIEFVEKCPHSENSWLLQFKQCQEEGQGRIPCDNCQTTAS
jgi:DtxR family Mn-dependent transcriptional regulator